MSNLHEKLSANRTYAKWHEFAGHEVIHWALFVVIAVGAFGTVMGQINPGSDEDLSASAKLSQSKNPADLISPPAGSNKPISGYIIVKYKSTTTLTGRANFRKAHGLSVKAVLPGSGTVVAEAIPPGADPEAVALDLQTQNPTTVEYATPDYPRYILTTTPDDPSFGSQWGLKNIYASTGWDISTGSPSIIVAVVDTGADWNHPELAGKLVTGVCLGGFSTTLCTASPDTQDVGGVSHGTHDACNIAANTDNSLGIAGVSWNAKIMPVKVCDGATGKCPGNIDGGILWAAQHGAKVISISLGGSILSSYDIDMIKQVYGLGAVVVVAAGNSGGLAGGFLAGVDASLGGNHILVVAATDQSNNKTSFSSYGPNVDVAAPGLSILSCKVGGYETLSGTSMATPTVAGLAALVFSVNPKLTNQQVIDLITKNAGAGDGTVTNIGTGVINVARTLAAAKATLGPAGPADTTPPSAPTNLSGSPSGGTQINLSWTASTDNVGVSGYKVTRNGGYVGFASATTYSDKGLSDGTNYTYALIALDAAGNQSATSSSIKVSTPDVTAPTVPTGVKAVAGTNQITLSWNASSDAVGVVGYHVYRDGTLLASTNSTTVSYSDSTVVSGKTYNYSVSAYDAAGNASVQSASIAAALTDTTAPSAPAGLSGTAPDSTKINLVWNAATDNVGVTGYNIYRGGTLLTSTASLTYTDISVVAGTSYTYTVKAYDSAGNVGPASTAVTVTVPAPADTSPPSPPSNLSVQVTSTKVSLSWTASIDNVGVTSYHVLKNGLPLGTTGLTSYSDTSVTVGQTYTYTVVAYDAAGNASGGSNAVSVTIPAAPDTTPPSTPTNLSASVNAQSKVALSWSASTDNIGVVAYRVLRGGTQIATSTSVSYTDNSVVAATTYSYAVQAVDAAGNRSSVSTSVTVTTPQAADTTAPSAPTNLTANATDSTHVSLSWTASSDNVGVTGYNIYRGGVWLASAPSTSYVDASLAAATTYTYTVKAYDASGNISGASNSVIIVTPTASVSPPTLSITSNTVASSGTTSAVIAWTTSVISTGSILYSTGSVNAAPGSSAGSAAITVPVTQASTTHNTSLSPLKSGTTYSYIITACDGTGNCVKSRKASFTTP